MSTNTVIRLQKKTRLGWRDTRHFFSCPDPIKAAFECDQLNAKNQERKTRRWILQGFEC